MVAKACWRYFITPQYTLTLFHKVEIFLEWERLTVLIYKKLKFILGEKCAYAFSKNYLDTPFPPPNNVLGHFLLQASPLSSPHKPRCIYYNSLLYKKCSTTITWSKLKVQLFGYKRDVVQLYCFQMKAINFLTNLWIHWLHWNNHCLYN